MIFKKENQAENTLRLERSGSPEQAVRREICLWYVIQDLMKLQDESGHSGQGERQRPSYTLLGSPCGLRDPRQKRRTAAVIASQYRGWS